MPHRQLLTFDNVVSFQPREPETEPLPSVNIFQVEQAGLVGIDAIVPQRVAVAFLKLLQTEGVVPALGEPPLRAPV